MDNKYKRWIPLGLVFGINFIALSPMLNSGYFSDDILYDHRVSLYINGVKVETAPISIGTSIVLGNNDFWLGHWKYGGRQFSGKIDEILVSVY
ncbi:hypothetical protein EA004_06425 [Vibrio anguillarum]|uniref:LamG domain-containing protein n=2 Tax=Vibrio anguillarum TaxID=55601 RepID=A0ABD4QTF1_VIBAN|nr:LamG-like jellyroll fold domain-containing protein [Vibrio anguillarum]ASG04770.1 hypothetical protein CEJ46_13285 [Vibrio anguillarum]MBF4244681.1 hypothetical protein [Vibrio anguillarum]MBF4280036.1 hypothetical protein [Vibrio anguillarum]MBT2918489.1 LamG domain-containing protein [Vibrio anguillarum]